MKNEVLIHIEKIKTNLLEKKYSKEDLMNPSVLSGSSARHIFFAAYDEYHKKNEYKSFVNLNLKEQINFINSQRISNHNFNGLVGFANCINLLEKKNYLINAEINLFSELDEFIIELSKYYIENKNYDPFYGFVGVGYLLLDRRSSNSKIDNLLIEFISKMLNHFDSIIVSNEFEKLELNISHGLTSVLQFMIKCVEELGYKSQNISFIERVYNFILSKQENFRIPDFITKENIKTFAPLRWCRGDLSTSYIIGKAAVLLDDKETFIQNKLVVDRLCSLRNNIEQELFSATICHGTLGVAHLFFKIQEIYTDLEVIIAKDYWYHESLILLNSRVKYDYVYNQGKHALLNGLLNGEEGIGIALLISLGVDKIYLDNFLQLN